MQPLDIVEMVNVSGFWTYLKQCEVKPKKFQGIMEGIEMSLVPYYPVWKICTIWPSCLAVAREIEVKTVQETH